MFAYQRLLGGGELVGALHVQQALAGGSKSE
jgi:hypothetical protein